jgi:hypothetical protein
MCVQALLCVSHPSVCCLVPLFSSESAIFQSTCCFFAEHNDYGVKCESLYETVLNSVHLLYVIKELTTSTVSKFLIEYVKDEVPIENCEGQAPVRTIYLLRTLLKNRDKVTTEEMQTYHMALEKEFRKNQRLSQEIIGTPDEVCLSQEE